MYEELDKENKIAFTESEIKTVFVQTEAKPWEHYRAQFEKRFSTKDFDVVFTANPFYRKDKNYWESRDVDTRTYYTIGYHLQAINVGGEKDLVSEIKSLIPDLEYLSENEDQQRFEDVKEKFSKIKQGFWNV